VLRTAGLVLADRGADPAAAVDRRPRVRADPLRGEAPGQPRPDDAARAGHVASAADDPAALPRPARSLDPRAPGSAPAGRRPRPRRPARRSHGLSGRVKSAATVSDTRTGLAATAHRSLLSRLRADGNASERGKDM